MFKIIDITNGEERKLPDTFDSIDSAEAYADTLDIEWYLIIQIEDNPI